MPDHRSPLEEYNKSMAPVGGAHGAQPASGPQMRVELAINDRAEAIIFHSQPFPHDLSWLEFDLDSSRLSFIMREGAIRDFGIAVRPELARYMQNAFQVLMVLMDEENGEPIEGGYIPLIIHRA